LEVRRLPHTRQGSMDVDRDSIDGESVIIDASRKIRVTIVFAAWDSRRVDQGNRTLILGKTCD
jgi:hypothetical protein